MPDWAWFLAFDDIIVIACVILFLVVKHRVYTLIATLLMALLLLINVIIIQGYRNWFVLALPFIALNALAFFGRWLLPRPATAGRANLAVSPTWRMFFISFIIAIGVILLLLSVLFLVFLNKS